MSLGVIQKKGDPNHLDGRMIVYAIVDTDPDELMNMKHPVGSMVHNGLLVAQGNYKDQNSLRDFLKSEMGLSLEEGLEQLLERAEGLEGALDPQKLKEKIEEMGEMEEFIPTPAKIVPFHSEQEILGQDGDVFFTGVFKSAGNAVLSVNSLPILYQARYREQHLYQVRAEIDALIAQIEQNEPPQERFDNPQIDIESALLKNYLPTMLYSRHDAADFEAAEQQFRTFMSGYPRSKDIDSMVTLIKNTGELSPSHHTLLELYVKKMAAVHHHDDAAVEALRKQIESIASTL
jgi:hypothetical protein